MYNALCVLRKLHVDPGDLHSFPTRRSSDLANIILEGIHRITAWSRIERGVGGPDARYVRAEDYKDRLPEMTLTPEKLLRSEEHTSELQSLAYLVCRLLLEKKKKQQKTR